MAKLTKDVFKETIKKLFEEKDYTVELVRMKKANNSYDGITLSNKSVRAIINLDSLYERYEQGSISFEEAIVEIETVFKNSNVEAVDYDSFAKKLNDIEYIKNHLVVEVYSKERNEEILQGIVYEEFEDLIIVPKIYLGVVDNKQSEAVTMVPLDMLKKIGLTKSEFIEHAIKSSMRLRPANIIDFKDMLLEEFAKQAIYSGVYQGDVAHVMKCMRKDDELMKRLFPHEGFSHIITNNKKMNGASAVFYPEVLNIIYEEIGSFYLLPSSIHEILVLKTSFHSVSELREMVSAINKDKTVINSEDILSDSVYFYDGKSLSRIA